MDIYRGRGWEASRESGHVKQVVNVSEGGGGGGKYDMSVQSRLTLITRKELVNRS